MSQYSDNKTNTDYGLTSNFGFVYQRRVFIKILIDNCFNLSDSFAYEGVDDISYFAKEDKLYSISFKKTAIQCKTGNLDYNSFLKMFENWLLVDKHDKYILFSEKDITFSFDNKTIKKDIRDNVLAYMESDKKKSQKSILYRLSKKYGFKNGAFVNNSIDSMIDYIYNRFDEPVVADYDTIVSESKNSLINNRIYDCKDNKTICDRRFDYFSDRINDLIDNNESKRVKTIINYSVFNFLLQKTILEINEDKPYLIDYVKFKERNYKRILDDESIINSREGKFLKTVFDSDKLVLTYLIYEYYYIDMRSNYIENNEKDKVNNSETTAYENYLLTKPENDLRIYFDSVTSKEIQSHIIVNSQYRRGCYIFLSSDFCDAEVFIDWNGKNEK